MSRVDQHLCERLAQVYAELTFGTNRVFLPHQRLPREFTRGLADYNRGI